MRNRFGLEIRKAERHHRIIELSLLKILQYSCRIFNKMDLNSIDIENSIFIFKRKFKFLKEKFEYIAIGVFLDYSLYEIKDGIFRYGNYDDPAPLLTFVERLSSRAKELPSILDKDKANKLSILITNLEFEYFPVEVLKKIPKQVLFVKVEKEDSFEEEITLQKIFPNSEEFFRHSINKEADIIRKINKERRFPKSHSGNTRDVDYESAIMNALRNGEGDQFGF